MVSRDHEVCLAAEHAEHRKSPSTTEFGDAAAEGAKIHKMEESRTRLFFDDCSMAWQIRFKSELAHYSSQLSQLLSGIPPAPTIHYANMHLVHNLKGIWEGYSWFVTDCIVAGAAVSLSLSASFVVQARPLEISFDTAATS